MTLDELPVWARELVASQRVARLAFLDKADHPRVLPVTFAATEDELWSAVDRKPKSSGGGEVARVRFLRRRPEAALCVDRYSDDWSRLAWVQVLVRVEIVSIEDGAAGINALVDRYPQYRHEPPPGPLLRLVPKRALHWRASGE